MGAGTNLGRLIAQLPPGQGDPTAPRDPAAAAAPAAPMDPAAPAAPVDPPSPRTLRPPRAPSRGRGQAASRGCASPAAGGGQPCPGGPRARSGLLPVSGADGAVTLGSSGRSPWLAALLRHLLPPRAWDRLCSPASRALRSQEGHPGFWRDAETSGAGILRLSSEFLLSPAQGCRVWFQEGESSLLRRCHLPAGTGRTGSGVRPAGRSLPELFSGQGWLWGVKNWEMLVLCPMRVCPWHRSHAVPQGTADLRGSGGFRQPAGGHSSHRAPVSPSLALHRWSWEG